MKRVITLVLSLIILTGTFSILPSSATAASSDNVPIVDKTVYLYTNKIFTGGNWHKTYDEKVTNGEYLYNEDKYSEDEQGYYIDIAGKKLTSHRKKPIITIYRYDSSTKKTDVKKLRITVKKTRKVKIKPININYGATKELKLPRYTKAVKFKFSKKNIIKIEDSGNYYHPIIRSLNYGTVKVTMTLKGTKIKLGSFKVTVKNIKPSIRKKYKTLTLKHSSKGNISGEDIHLKDMLLYPRSKAKYSVSIKNKKTAGTYYSYPDTLIYARKIGKTKAIVYETLHGKKRKIGTFNINIKKAKMKDVLAYEASADGLDINDIILQPGKSVNLKKYIVDLLSDFKKSEYKISYYANYPEALSVDKKGIVTCHSKPDIINPYIFYTVKFSDGSKYEWYTNIWIDDE